MADNFFMLDEDAYFYVNLGTDAMPVWTLAEYAEEVSIEITKVEIELPAQVTGFRLSRGGDFEAPISFTYSRARNGITDAVHNKLVDSLINKKPVEFAWTDLPIADVGAFGFRVWSEVMKYPFKKVNDESQAIAVEAKPTDYCEADALIFPKFIGAPAS